MHKHLAVVALSTALTSAAFGEQLVDKSHGFNGIERLYIEQECSANAGAAADAARAASLAAHAENLTCAGDFKEAMSVYKEALKSDNLTSADKGELYTGLGYTAIAADKFRYAKNLLKKAVASFEQAGDSKSAAKAEIWLAKALIMQGHTKDAAELLEGALASLKTTDGAEKEVVVGNTLLVYAYDQRRESEKAAELIRNFAASGQFDVAAVTNIPLYGRNPSFRGKAAQTKGQTRGDVTLEFTVANDGSVQNAAVVASTSSSEFERVALNAIQNFRFLPAGESAEPVKYSFHWDMEEQTGVNIQTPRPPHGTASFGSVRFGLENVMR